ncbi:hypothetical protein DH2020_014213 [Rehmannia glutinosa]|uniref:Reverse transcriptase n=1 Tax=Rehmannia glutinosa TaxID=99300 RepID=A0ABR0WX97_REHGL
MAESDSHASSGSGTKGNLWKWLWALNVPTKIKIFLWKCAHGILPTKTKLRRKGMDITPLCSRCELEEETIEHALRDCKWAEFFWAVSPLRITWTRTEERGSIGDWLNRMRQHGETESQGLFAFLMWSIWSARNRFTFNGIEEDHNHYLRLATSRMEDYSGVRSEGVTLGHQPATEQWKPPAEGVVKINVDASIREKSGTGIRVIIRDWKGQVLKTPSRYFPSEYEVEVAEGLACREELQLARDMELKQVVLETDNLNLSRRLARPADDLTYFGNVVLDILDLAKNFDSFSPSFIKRSGNIHGPDAISQVASIIPNIWNGTGKILVE